MIGWPYFPQQNPQKVDQQLHLSLQGCRVVMSFVSHCCIVAVFWCRNQFPVGKCTDLGVAGRLQQRWILQAIWIPPSWSHAQEQLVQVTYESLSNIHEWCKDWRVQIFLLLKFGSQLQLLLMSKDLSFLVIWQGLYSLINRRMKNNCKWAEFRPKGLFSSGVPC